MLNRFQGFLPVKEGSGLLQKAAKEGLTYLRGNAAECCGVMESFQVRRDYSGVTSTFPSPGFGRRNQAILDELQSCLIESVSFMAGERSYQMSGAVKDGTFLLVTDLPVPEVLLWEVITRCSKRIFLAEGEGKLSIASLYRSDEKPGTSLIAKQKLLNAAYILLFNLARQEILTTGRLYEVDLLSFPEREELFALGRELLELGAFTAPAPLLKVIFSHIPKELRSELEVTLLSEKESLPLCRNDRLLPWEGKAEELFQAGHVRLVVRLGHRGENLCCWRRLA